MPRKKKYPNYDPKKVMTDLLDAVSELYESGLSLRKIGEELDLDQQKVRKLLCTAHFRGMIEYNSATAEEVLYYYKEKKSVADIMAVTGLSRASVQSYLPYTKVPYKESEVSANAERLRLFRERQRAVEELQDRPETLWEAISLFQGYLFHTEDGKSLKYKVQGNKMYINRDDQIVSKSAIKKAYKGIMKGDTAVFKKNGMKEEYFYPIFKRLKVLDEAAGQYKKNR